MKLEWHIVFSLALVLSVSACQKEGAGCFESRGDLVSEQRSLEGFEDVYVDGRVNVVLVQDSLNFAVVDFGENGIAGIESYVENGALYIDEINQCDWMRKIYPLPLVEVHYTSFSNLYSKSAAEIRFENFFTSDSINIEVNDAAGSIQLKAKCQAINIISHTGATDIRAEGTTDELYIYNSSYAPIRAEKMEARIASVHNNSSGDTYVRASEVLNTTIEEDGDIHVFGGPEIRGTQKGVGQVFIAD